MRIEGKEIELPVLLQNPFSTSPLEEGQKGLLVGRNDIFDNLSQYINFRSTRRILMVGSVGSGRTSLLRCLANVAPLSLHVDHIHASAPAKSLLESLYSQLVGPNIPSHYTAIVSEMVETSKSFTGKLPLVVIDVPTVDSSVLNVALRDTLPVIERLQVMMVVVLDHKQKAHLPQSVLKRFDMVNTLNPLNAQSIQQLVDLRIRSVCSTPFSLPIDDAEHLLATTDGLPASIIRVMRDAVDSNRMAQNHGTQGDLDNQYQERRGFDTSAVLPTQQPEASTSTIFTSKQDLIDEDLANQYIEADNYDEVKLDASTAQNQQNEISPAMREKTSRESGESSINDNFAENPENYESSEKPTYPENKHNSDSLRQNFNSDEDEQPKNQNYQTNDSPLVSDGLVGQNDAEDSEIIDASSPWQDRIQENEDTENTEDTEGSDTKMQQISDSTSTLFGFDLDLDDLGNSKEGDEPLKETPFDVYDSVKITNETTKPTPIAVTGMFGSLVGRMRNSPTDSEQGEVDYEEANNEVGAELWVAKDSNLLENNDDDLIEGDGTALLYDETGLLENGQQNQPQLNQKEGDSDYQGQQELHHLEGEFSPDHESDTTSMLMHNADMKKFSQLVNALQTALLAPQKADGSVDRRKLIDALTSLRQPRVGERIDHPLNANVLSNLSPHEAVVVATANERKYSPSDRELLIELNVKRARLSQISNRLLKNGILNVRKVGKSRMFTLTQAARAQLSAWKMIGGEA